jgi:hypothetical protein
MYECMLLKKYGKNGFVMNQLAGILLLYPNRNCGRPTPGFNHQQSWHLAAIVSNPPLTATVGGGSRQQGMMLFSITAFI